MFGSMSGSPNPAPMKYLCKTCGVTVPPYESFCDRRREVGELHEKPNLLHRFMHRLLGTGPYRHSK